MNTRVQIPMKSSAAPRQSFTPGPFATVHRKCACGGSGGECAECKKKGLEQAADSGAGFGHDFGKVRIHESAAIKRQAIGEQADEPEKAGEGYMPPQPEQSALIPAWVAALFSEQGPPSAPAASAPPEKEATVSTSPLEGGTQSNSPESEAMSESPYQTGMTTGQLAADLEGGQPLESGLRSSFESRYGHSLSHVRIHADDKSASLCRDFEARAFAFRNHIAFGRDMYQPNTVEGNSLLRHEVTHVLQDGSAEGGAIKRAALCAGTCPPAGALPFVPVSDASFNCYAYAVNSPGSGFLQPGSRGGTPEFTDLTGPNPARRAAAAATYFTPAGMLRNMSADLGAPISTNCNSCCTSPKRKIIAVTTDPMSSVGANHWDFHWYRKDADGAWSHKRGSLDAQRDDAGGASPICNPCSASRSYAGFDYKNVVGSWCV
jgi:hypothetical protein